MQERSRENDRPPEAAPIISLRGVKKTYAIGKNELAALNGVDLDIFPGEFVCIVGRSGSGKSTLLNMMAGLEKPSKGSIIIAGKHIERLSEAGLVRFRLENIGFIFQSFNLFPSLTALENVAMPLVYRGERRRRRNAAAREILVSMGLSEHMKHRPTQMSGGQQQRVGIARALVVRPKIIFADEPTGNLDSATSHEIMSLIRRISRQQRQTLVMVTHDAELARWGDRTVHLLDGLVTNVEINAHVDEMDESDTDQTQAPHHMDAPDMTLEETNS